MERRTLEIKLGHAEDLSSVKLVGKMDIYAVVTVSDEHNDVMSLTNKSPVDHGGDTTPTWNFMMRFKVDETALQTDSLTLRFELICRSYSGDAAVGDAEISVKHLFDLSTKDAAGVWWCDTQPVRKPDGIPQGHLRFSYKFSEKIPAFYYAPPPPPPPPPPPQGGDSWFVRGLKIVLPIIVGAVCRNIRANYQEYLQQ